MTEKYKICERCGYLKCGDHWGCICEQINCSDENNNDFNQRGKNDK